MRMTVHIILACILVVIFLIYLFDNDRQGLKEGVEAAKEAEELYDIGHEVMGLQEHIMIQEMKQEAILEEVKK